MTLSSVRHSAPAVSIATGDGLAAHGVSIATGDGLAARGVSIATGDGLAAHGVSVATGDGLAAHGVSVATGDGLAARGVSIAAGGRAAAPAAGAAAAAPAATIMMPPSITVTPQYRVTTVAGRRWALVRRQPSAVIVERTPQTGAANAVTPRHRQRIPIPDTTRRALRGVLGSALIAWVVLVLVERRLRRRARGSPTPPPEA